MAPDLSELLRACARRSCSPPHCGGQQQPPELRPSSLPWALWGRVPVAPVMQAQCGHHSVPPPRSWSVTCELGFLASLPELADFRWGPLGCLSPPLTRWSVSGRLSLSTTSLPVSIPAWLLESRQLWARLCSPLEMAWVGGPWSQCTCSPNCAPPLPPACPLPFAQNEQKAQEVSAEGGAPPPQLGKTSLLTVQGYFYFPKRFGLNFSFSLMFPRF